MTVYIVTEDNIIEARIAHDAMQARRARRINGRAGKTRDYRRHDANHGPACDCNKCWSAMNREARKNVPMYDAPVAPARNVKCASVEYESYSTAVVGPEADVWNAFDIIAVERDRSKFAIGLWGIRRFVA